MPLLILSHIKSLLLKKCAKVLGYFFFLNIFILITIAAVIFPHIFRFAQTHWCTSNRRQMTL